MRMFVAALGTETNTFSPIPTGVASFEEYIWHPAGTHPDEPTFFTGPVIAARLRGQAQGFTVIEGLSAYAAPAGLTTALAWATLRDQVLEQLRAAMPVEIALVSLHGAMVAQGQDDCEGELLAAMRAIAGPEVVIGAEVDPHCHLTPLMVESADLLVLYKEYPHTDTYERAEELVTLSLRAARGEIRPVMAMAECRMIGTFHTTREPVKGFVAAMQALEGKDGILSVSLAHCFPWADVPELGARTLVVADGDLAKAQALADQLALEVRAMAGNTAAAMLSHGDGIARALAMPERPIVLADTADNAGGGAPSDSTFILKLLLDQGVQEVALGPFWDPVALRFCELAGVGSKLRLRLGGKVGPASGAPLDVEAEVLALHRNGRQRFSNGWTELGDVAAIRVGGVDILLNTIRTQAFDPVMFTDYGISLDDKKLIVVKSSQHFYARFAPIAADVLWLDGPGALAQRFTTLPYARLRRPIWPLDPMD